MYNKSFNPLTCTPQSDTPYLNRYAHMKKYLLIILLVISNSSFSEIKSEIKKNLEKDKIQVSICKNEIKNNSEKIISECSNAFKMVILTGLSVSQIKEDYKKPYIEKDLKPSFKQRVKETIELHEKIKEDLYSAMQNLNKDTILKIRDQAIEKF